MEHLREDFLLPTVCKPGSVIKDIIYLGLNLHLSSSG